MPKNAFGEPSMKACESEGNGGRVLKQRRRRSNNHRRGVQKPVNQSKQNKKIASLNRDLVRYRKLPTKSRYVRHRIKVLETTLKKITEPSDARELPTNVTESFEELTIDEKMSE